MTLLATASSPEVARGSVVVVPIGSTEQHGPHLPLDTDTVVAEAVAAGVAQRLDAWCAPAVAYGSSGEHQHFAGTVSIGTPALTLLLVELARSLRCWARRVVLVNGHGGNRDAIVAAVGQLRAEGHDTSVVWCSAPGMDAHAGRAETSIMLHLRPETVRLDRLEAGNQQPIESLIGTMQAQGVADISPNGVLGDPHGATAEEGARLLAFLVDRDPG